jgi:hypothetical protein
MNSEKEMMTYMNDGHPDENQILLALERELPPEGIAEIEEHLGQCWNCRARSEEMRRGILAFVEYRENRYLASLDGPPNEFRTFPFELRKTIAENASSGLATSLRHALSKLLALPAAIRWSTAVAVITAIALFWTQVLFDPAIVSANELLTRAIAAQSAAASSGKRQAIRQTVQIRNGQKSFVRNFTWTTGGPKPQTVWGTKETVEEWDWPLTAECFANWRNSLVEKDDRVTRSHQILTLTTTAQSGPVKKASIAVREVDFHPVEQHILFADQQTLDLFELDFKVDNEVTRSEQKASQQTASPSREGTGRARGNLDEIEVEVRYKLFAEKLDLGEDLQIGQAGNEVSVTGIASSQERASAIALSLRGMDNVRVRVISPETARTSRRVSDSARASSGEESQVAVGSPLAESLLSREFPPEKKADFVNAWLAASENALSHAWAMKRIAERYSASEESRLNRDSAAKLREMLRAHLQEVEKSNAELDSLSKVLPGAKEELLPGVSDSREGVLEFFREVQRQDSLLAKLVASTPPGAEDLPTASGRFRNAHRATKYLSGKLRDLLEEK